MISRLPNAPLTEVVFEMRWGVLDDPLMPIPIDPGYPILLDAFSSYADKKGFNRTKDYHPTYAGIGKSISKRFYRGTEDFPLLQIGHGLYAANDSAAYEWKSFKKMALEGAAVVVREYPKLKNFELGITHLELRYLDTFEEALLGTSDIIAFVNEGTEASFSIPAFWDSAQFGQKRRGRIQIEADLREPSGSIFSIDIASARKDEVPVIRMESKVLSKGEKVIPSRRVDNFVSNLDNWLEAAHEISSKSFKEIISKHIFEQFK